ncbi:dihydrofolate reductase family protein [Rickettsiales endosymbiont of Stachyamoeba lipophora]|uniref:dihydrofolate reductase family protein n=1 Tax=Rickettsiales endosymbiont of Stachyamoeba lipophora TaxID=2486578 RepID=UPI000F64A3FC|nr:dihydrofolate reductase family protein [Rickettsiales endosymbiont of Stachyamoeba lipophora]AZL16382.1 dihydrofolate reductase [Rickettsiales endosymbiont of Stachyamoeba lipophora]
MKIILYIATSQDGFIADKNGSVDWLNSYNNIEGEDCGYAEFYNSIDIIVMGSHSYEQILGFGEWPYKEKDTYIFTKRNLKSDLSNVFFISKNPKVFIQDLNVTEPTQQIWLLGGTELIKSFDQHNLIDEVIITVVPTELGQGIKLELSYANFELTDQKVCKAGIIQKVMRRNNQRK